jgi:hypothetical protein
MEPDLSKYFAELTRLKRANPKLNRAMLETCLQSLFYDDLAALRRSAAITIPVIYDEWIANEGPVPMAFD